MPTTTEKKPLHKKQTYKLSTKQRDFLTQQLAEFKKPADVLREFREKWPKLKWGDIYQFSYRQKEHIEAVRADYLIDIASIPLTHTKIRVMALEKLYGDADKTADKITCIKEIREEMLWVQSELPPGNAEKKEAEAFISSLGYGQTNLVDGEGKK